MLHHVITIAILHCRDQPAAVTLQASHLGVGQDLASAAGNSMVQQRRPGTPLGAGLTAKSAAVATITAAFTPQSRL